MSFGEGFKSAVRQQIHNLTILVAFHFVFKDISFHY